jgi:hypothetical protein
MTTFWSLNIRLCICFLTTLRGLKNGENGVPTDTFPGVTAADEFSYEYVGSGVTNILCLTFLSGGAFSTCGVGGMTARLALSAVVKIACL